MQASGQSQQPPRPPALLPPMQSSAPLQPPKLSPPLATGAPMGFDRGRAMSQVHPSSFAHAESTGSADEQKRYELDL